MEPVINRTRLTLLPNADSDFFILVLNSSTEMAKEITSQLSLEFPGAALIFAPSLALAELILRRKRVRLIVSSEILPDGHVSKLEKMIKKSSTQPDLVVVGDLSTSKRCLFNRSLYHLSECREMAIDKPSAKIRPIKKEVCEHKLKETISNLGDQFRNDLNNPLQAIVAMVYVAQKSQTQTGVIKQALDAIEKSAHNMASIVNSLEEKIKVAVIG